MEILNKAIDYAIQNPEFVTMVAVPVAAGIGQSISVAVKKSPWGWDNSLLDWIKKNKAGFSFVFKLLIKRNR